MGAPKLIEPILIDSENYTNFEEIFIRMFTQETKHVVKEHMMGYLEK